MRLSVLVGAMALVAAGAASGAPYYPSNAAEFVVPADELDAATIGEAAVHAGFRPVAESDPRFSVLKSRTEQTYGIWELPSRKFATIVLTRGKRTNRFEVTFTAKEPGRSGDNFTGDVCKKWLAFSAAMRSEFILGQSKFRFRNPQCTP
ncbi:MAG TPA: hypothetical protein VMF58_04420 [Rhizomicrobium sp.]|nr:hypothetical protein [Rhizomicrobium sp.]